MHADLERLLAKDLLPDVTAVPLGDLRRLRVACSEAETDVSFVRRVAQGRLDIVGYEVRRRSGSADDGGPVNGDSLLFDLPDVLTLGTASVSPGARRVAIQEPGVLAHALLEQLDAAVSPSELTTPDQIDDHRLTETMEDLRRFEIELSANRRRLHERIDSIQGEIARRYRDGEASIDSLLN